MRMIKKVNILGKDYSVEYNEELMALDYASGICRPWVCAIEIGTDLAAAQERDVLIHETFHGIFSETALTADFPEVKVEENIVRRMASGVLQVMRANPQWVKLLTAKD